MMQELSGTVNKRKLDLSNDDSGGPPIVEFGILM